jgi:O-methyltransferase
MSFKKGALKKISYWLLRIPVKLSRKTRFEYGVGFYEEKYREEFFYNAMRFIAFNQVKGDYLEFGVFGGNTFSLAYKHSRLHRNNMHLYGFDSFKGLPKPEGIDTHPQWVEGEMAMNMTDFKNCLTSNGIDESKYTLVPGFYKESLTAETRKKLSLKKAAVVYIDCDLYESTVPVLNFVLPLLQNGTIVAFDDWFCFNGDPERGGQLATKEFLQNNPNVKFIDYLTYGWHGKSFIVKIN